MQIRRENGFFRDLAQGDDRIFIAVAVKRQFGATGNFTGALRRKQDELVASLG